MDVATARILLCAIASAGTVLWLVSLRNLLAARRGSASRRDDSRRAGGGHARVGESILGSVELDGDPPSLLERLVAMLATGSWAGFSLVSIIDRGDDDVVFEIRGWGGRGDASGGPLVQGRVSMRRAGGGRSRAEYQAHIAMAGGLLRGAAIVQALGLFALVGGFGALWTFVASSENPQVRLQVLQMLQAIHFLWPPFLLVSLHRRFARVVDSTLRTTLQNLPYM